MQDFMEISEYLTDMEWTRCYDLFLKGVYSRKWVSREVLDQVYKLYIRPHLEYGDIIYHKFDPNMHLEFTKKLEQVQYSAAFAVTGAWRGTSR